MRFLLGLFGTPTFDHGKTVIRGLDLLWLVDLRTASAVFVKRQQLPRGLVLFAVLLNLLIRLENQAVLDRVTHSLAVSALETGDGNALVSLEGRARVRILVVLEADTAAAAGVVVVLGNAESQERHEFDCCAVIDVEKNHFNFF